VFSAAEASRKKKEEIVLIKKKGETIRNIIREGTPIASTP